MSKRLVLTFVSLFIICLAVGRAEAQPHKYTFTYQGKLTDSGAPANGNYDLKFALFDSATGDFEARPPQTVTNVPVVNGVFTVNLYFGATAFVGPPRFLEISARPTGTGAFTLLTPRQPINPAPYASYSFESAFAERTANAELLGGVAAAQYVQTNDARLTDARTPTAGSGSYIQNGSSAQTDANFNISGDGKAGGTLSANVVNAATQYNINSTRVLSVTGAGGFPVSNTFAGAGAGTSTTPTSNTTMSPAGHFNSFFGLNAGTANTTGAYNSFFGANAGKANTTGLLNTFFGNSAGTANTIGSRNSFFGDSAGSQNTSGLANSFFGLRAGSKNTTGSNNSFFGNEAGSNITTGSLNSFFGDSAGIFATTGDLNSFFGHRSGWKTTSGSFNVIVGYDAGQYNTTGNWNSFFGTAAGWSNATGNSNTYLGNIADGTADISNSTAIGARAKVTESNSLVLGSINGVNGATADTKVGIGTTAPTYKLQVVDPSNTGLRVQTNTTGGTVGSFGGFGDFQIDSNGLVGGRFTVRENGNVGIGTNIPDAKLDVAGKVRIGSLGTAGITQLCQNSFGEIANCSSSLRYKTAFRPFTSGLNLVNQLHPLTFRWKSDQSSDLGLGAEDVAAVEPLLVTHNANGEVEGVKYDRLAVVLVNAVKEQQAQIERQQAEIAELKKLVCKSRRRATVCK
jgi:hypothetical protein